MQLFQPSPTHTKSVNHLSISIAFLSYSIISSQKRSIEEFVSGSSDTLRKDDQSCNSSKEDEKHQGGSPRVKSTSVSTLESDEEPKIITPGSIVLRKGDASENSLACWNNEEEEEEEDDEIAPIISDLSGDDERGILPKYDDGQEDAPSVNTISTEDAALTKSTDDEENPANVPPISSTASDASKTIRQHRTTSAGGSGSRDITSPVNKGGDVWYCCRCKDYNNRITPQCYTCIHCMHRKCYYCG